MWETAVRLSNVVVTYGATRALDVDDLSFASGDVHVLVGDNGSGKTTLLRVIAGLCGYGSGLVRVLDKDLANASLATRRGVLRRVTLCMQSQYLFDTTVQRNVEYGLRAHGIEGEERDRRVREALDAVGLGDFHARRAKSLSGGETQRVAIARAMALEPDIALLDEPTASVDQTSRALVERGIERLRDAGSTVIVATHQVEQAYRLSARVVRLEGGRAAGAGEYPGGRHRRRWR